MIKKRQLEKITTVDDLYCDTCKKRIATYGNNWIVLQNFEGEWKDNPKELTESHFCNMDCLSEFVEENK